MVTDLLVNYLNTTQWEELLALETFKTTLSDGVEVEFRIKNQTVCFKHPKKHQLIVTIKDLLNTFNEEKQKTQIFEQEKKKEEQPLVPFFPLLLDDDDKDDDKKNFKPNTLVAGVVRYKEICLKRTKRGQIVLNFDQWRELKYLLPEIESVLCQQTEFCQWHLSGDVVIDSVLGGNGINVRHFNQERGIIITLDEITDMITTGLYYHDEDEAEEDDDDYFEDDEKLFDDMISVIAASNPVKTQKEILKTPIRRSSTSSKQCKCHACVF